MTKGKITKRSLWMSVLSLLLCLAMLLGTTFAWFTDSVTSENNIIKSGNLDIELEYWNGEAWVDVAGQSEILTNELWEPGVTEVAYLRVANAGSLALKYQLGINIVSEIEGVNVAGESFKLSDYIQFGVVEDVNGETDAYDDRNNAVADVTDSKKISAGFTKEAAMESGEELYIALVLYMPTTVGNEANHNGTDVPEINLGINVVATQGELEEDSFGSDYDASATFPKRQINVTEQQTVVDKIANDGALTEEVSVGRDQGDAQAIVPAGVQMVPGATELTLTVNTIQNSEANVEVNQAEEESLSVDVHMDGIAADNTVPMKITLKGIVRPGLNASNIQL